MRPVKPLTGCCRSRPTTSSRDFCANLSLSTPITLQKENDAFVVYVATPGGQKMLLHHAIQQYKCASKTTGLRLSEVVLEKLAHVTPAATAVLQARVGRSMPLIMLKELLYRYN